MSPFEQPAGVQPRAPAEFPDGNDQFAHDLAVEMRTTFADYQNRDSSDNRSAQIHMGPSEIGESCDRRIAMGLLGVPPSNPGNDGFAAWLGTQGHRGVADIYEWANGRSGRFAIETRIEYDSDIVPKGTGDLLHRVRRCFIDHKFMGYWSLKKLRESGPSTTYRTQIHVYAYGARRRGEKVEHVAIAGWPRQGNSLDEFYVWHEPYDARIAEEAFKRVEAIGKQVKDWARDGGTRHERAQFLASFGPDKESCKYCRFHLAKATDLSHACPGK